jgi:hypothetical protein
MQPGPATTPKCVHKYLIRYTKSTTNSVEGALQIG